MNISLNSLVTPDEILSDVLMVTGDFDHREFPRGWYISQIQQSLEELSFDTYMNVLDHDFEFPSETMAIALPANTFNVKGIWVYNGLLGSPTDSQNVRWKRGAFTRGPDKSFIAENKPDQTEDLWIIPPSNTAESELLWASIQNGVIQFSSKCSTYTYVHLRYNGTLTPIGETPFVPQFFRQAVKLWTLLEYYRVMKGRNPRTYRASFKDTHDELHASFTGKWDQALKRSRSLDTKAASDLKEYLSRMNY